ncbi:MAG: RidA family protein [Candidatus Dormibacteraeota bacterium]|nr:RidA family protein [Candidatus Dormibacteraeota bacterium]
MGLQRLTPEGLFKPAAYTQVIVATGRRMVFVSGQVSMDARGQLVAPGDVAGQARQVYANLRAALEGAGVKPTDVVKLTTYVVGYKPEIRPVLGEARSTVFGPGDLPASTLVGVQALAEPGYLIEVEAIAVTDQG